MPFMMCINFMVVFSDDEENDYYPEVDEAEVVVPSPPEVMNTATLAPVASESSSEAIVQLGEHEKDSGIANAISDTEGPCQASQSFSVDHTTAFNGHILSVVCEREVVVCTHVANDVVSGDARAFESNPEQQEVDVVVISSSEDEA
ncbi:uncharacterized protein LOC113299539 [Papaver somniferum]|uniref:uncharacterized protein LOC113299539 n=1 Tax=Papaver somniferum TaxID=3469 RepID=UPI000E6FFDB0|nr:uncharacterized protein LOC113299539 [Papaver somniferum]